MSSVFAVNSNEEGGSIIPDVEEFTEFHPDQLSSLVDIQEELEKLRDVNIEEVMSTVEDVEVVGREVTIRGDQSSEGASILPDIQEEPMILDQDVSLSDVVMEETVEVGETVIEETVDVGESVIEEIIDVEDSVIEETVFGEPVIEETVDAGETLIEETVEVGETVIEEIIDVEDSEIEETVGEICAIGVSKKSVDNVRNTVGSSHSKVLSPVSVGRGPPPLKAIRPVTEALVANKKNSSFITMAQPKKKMMTRVIFSPNSDAAPDAPIIYGEAGGQAIRFIGPNKKIITNSPKTITLAQAKEMGLISSKNIHQFHKAKGLVKKGVMVGGNKFAMLKASPTKILPLPGQLHPIAPSPTMAGPPQKVFIRQGGTIKTGTLSGTFITTSGSAGTQNHILQLPQDNNQLHPLQLPGKQVQFVRLVNSATTPSVPPPLEAITTAPSTISPKPSNNTQLKMLSLAPTQTSSASKNVNSFERVMVSPGLNGKQDGSNVVMVPTEYVKPYKPHTVTPSPPPPPVPPPPLLVKPTPAVSKASNMSGPPPPSPAYKAKEVSSTKEHFTVKAAKVTEPPNGIRPRKPCNCTKSQCLKLYCDCFANGEFCHECNCNCCYNNLNHEEERQRAIKACLDRNPAAFRPKIGKGYIGNERRHNKGCNCKRSGCLKNYCECYEAKIPCSNNCKCIGCRNVEDNREVRNRSSHEGNRMYQQLAVKHKLSTEIQESAFMPQSLVMNQVARQPFNLMTQEVVEATCQCLLAQVEGEGQLNEHVERLIIEEFGRCLVEIIDCATRTSVNNSTT